jgi:hypothetical protein
MVHQDAHGLVKLTILMAKLNQIGNINLVNYPICYAYYATYLPIYINMSYLPTYLTSTYLFIYQLIHLPTYLFIYLPTYLYIPTYISHKYIHTSKLKT